MLRASWKGFMGLCRINFLSLLSALNLVVKLPADRESAWDFFLFQGVYFPLLLTSPGEGVCVSGSAAVSVCLPVAVCCTDTPTGGRHKLNPVTLVAPSPTKLYWVDASHVSAVGLSAVWVPASRVSVGVFLHLHNSELRVSARAWWEFNWATWLPICWLLLPEIVSGQALFSITFRSSLRLIWGFRTGVRSLGCVSLWFGFSCKLRFGFSLST